MYEAVTAFIPRFEALDLVQLEAETAPKRSECTSVFPWADTIYGPAGLHEFLGALGPVLYHNPAVNPPNYRKELEKRGIDFSFEAMDVTDVQAMDAQSVLYILLAMTRAERFCDGVMYGFLKSGTLVRWLRRLRELDEADGLLPFVPD